MKENKHAQRKRRLTTGLALLLALTLILSLAAPFFSSAQGAVILPEAVQSEQIQTRQVVYDEKENYVKESNITPQSEMGRDLFSLKMTVGNEGNYRVGTSTLFLGTLKNQSEKFDGKLKVKVYSGDSSGDASGEYSIYYAPISLEKGEEKEISFYADVMIINNFFEVSIVDSKDKVVFLKNVYATPLIDTPYEDGFSYDKINAIKSVSSDFDVIGQNRIMMIWIIMGIYVAIVGPILYFILKKKDKRELGWIYIPVMAVSFTMLIFMISQNSGYRNGLLQVSSISEISESKGTANTKLMASLKTPQKDDVKFEMEKSGLIRILDKRYRGYYNRQDEGHKISEIAMEGNPTITYFDNQSWDENNFYMEKETDLDGKLENNITIVGNRYIGTIKNGTEMDFLDVVICLGGKYYKYGDLKKGESLDIDTVMTDRQGEEYMPYETLRNLYKISDEALYDMAEEKKLTMQKIKNKEMTKEDAYLINQEKESMSTFISLDFTDIFKNGKPVMVFYGFSEESVLDGEKTINGKNPAEKYFGIYRMNMELPWDTMGEIEFPYGYFYPKNIESIGNVIEKNGDRNTFHQAEKGETKFMFEIPKGVNLSSFEIKVPGGSDLFYDSHQILNEETNEWEVLSGSAYENTLPYLNKNGDITVKLFLQDEFEGELPELKWSGGGNHAGN